MSSSVGRVVRRIESPTIVDVEAARGRIAATAMRTPLVELQVDAPSKIYLKLENLQPIGSFKLRGALNAMRSLDRSVLAQGVYTASAGNMAQGVAFGAREIGVPCTVIMPDSAPRAKIDAVRRLGAEIVSLPYDDWWQTLADHGRAGVPGTFIHPVADAKVIAGNGTIGLEIVEDLPEVDAVLVPFGGGGLVSGIATAVHALAPRAKVYGCEVATATPLAAAFAAHGPVVVERTPSFVDGIGGRGVLPEMWPLIEQLVDGALVAALDEVGAAIKLLVERAHVVAEGAGATPVAAALGGRLVRDATRADGPARVVCVVSGGNIDSRILIDLLSG
ncbi:MAG TPA: threonine/serine dehydratase [Gemmatimonadaceae bacterium]|nr:threonine/serine dehydratase [Gemmatimonadaceae bacterium]